MRTLLVASILAFDATVARVTHARAQSQRARIEYTISMPEPASHLYEVALFVSGVGGRPVELQMPVWAPGNHARADFARNVQDFFVAGSDGRPLRWTKVDGSRWRVFPGVSRSLRVRYRVFANAPLSGTFSVLDSLHANWNGASLFMYVDGRKQEPVTLAVNAPGGWTIINGEVSRPGQRLFHFGNYDLMADTPTEVAPAGALLLESFVADNRLYRVMVHHRGALPAGARERLLRDLENVVRYQNNVFGPPPIDQYTFMFNVGFPGAGGNGHLGSAQIHDPSRWVDTTALLPGIAAASRQYFKVWNAKRVRPAGLGPFDYAREPYVPSLWVAEGWTHYYGLVTLRRGGVEDTYSFYRRMAEIIRQNLTAPGRKHVSARMASFHASFWDSTLDPQPANREQVYFSYDVKGAGIAAFLDLFIRNRSGNTRSLNHAFNNLKTLTWNAPRSSYYLQGRGYTEGDVQQAVTQAAGAAMHDWFDRYVEGTEDLPFEEALAWAGLTLVRSESGPWRIEEMPDPSAAQLRVRLGWVTGRHDR